jgi:hypothetical protein
LLVELDRNTFNDISGDALLTTVIQASGAGIAMTRKMLHGLKRNPLI